MKVITVNKAASFEYYIEDRYEAVIVLEWSEVNIISAGNFSLKD